MSKICDRAAVLACNWQSWCLNVLFLLFKNALRHNINTSLDKSFNLNVFVKLFGIPVDFNAIFLLKPFKTLKCAALFLDAT